MARVDPISSSCMQDANVIVYSGTDSANLLEEGTASNCKLQKLGPEETVTLRYSCQSGWVTGLLGYNISTYTQTS